ncbi:MAG: glycoside hydrolase family 9 protein [Bacteroidales bacterium]
MKPISVLSCLLFSLLILVSCRRAEAERTDMQAEHIRMNQVGYPRTATKEFLVAGLPAQSFRIRNARGRTVARGRLEDRGVWEASGEGLLRGDFSRVKRPGRYTVLLNTGLESAPFVVMDDVYDAPLRAAAKSFYFQRASLAVDVRYGDVFEREAGHPDLQCTYHPSSGRNAGTHYSPGGWYDAGDYGKYVVNGALSVGQMLNLLELDPGVLPDGSLSIPEGGNGKGDLLDELRYELDWLVTMQDTDGGVFHKLTTLDFEGFVMPEQATGERYVIGKGTAATLDFAAVMAQASRVYAATDPDWSRAILYSARDAWNWAMAHADSAFSNPPDVHTGEYGDRVFDDDFYWAAAELFLSTGDEKYRTHLTGHPQPYGHRTSNSWKYFVRNTAFHSLLLHPDRCGADLWESLKKSHLDLAGQLLHAQDSIPGGIGLEEFAWGSNSDVLNQAMILCMAHHLDGNPEFLEGARRNLDYVLGMNATGVCYLTGFGSRPVMNPHHRPSGADNNVAPVPGFVVGGPNAGMQDRQVVRYESDRPAKAFEDVQESYASNEVCLNWNAPAVFVLAYLDTNR